MRLCRTLTVVLAGVSPLLAVALAAGPANAHGTVDNPVSRVLACSPDGPHAQSAACLAAFAASGREAFAAWDNIRVAGVQGRDREVILDGRLCSGGVDQFGGLDLPGTDWPATRLVAGADLTVTYRVTIPHQGTFRLYVTKDGYDPDQPLAWSDLEEEPFLTVTGPALAGDAYVLAGRLPDGKAGRHVIYTIWQNSDTPDTYYSCSDVVFDPAAGTTSLPGPAGPGNRSTEAGSGPAESEGPAGLLLLIAGGAVVLGMVVAGGVSLLRRRRF